MRAVFPAMKHTSDNEAVKPALLSVYSGRDCVGFLLSRGKVGCEAFDANEKSLGIFPSEKAAADAVIAEIAAGNLSKEFPHTRKERSRRR
jgi:hypothetical protein